MIYDFVMDSIEENTSYWYVCENVSANQRILDVGCATGYLGAYLKNNFENLDLVGVDYQDFHLEKASKRSVYSDLIKLDLNSSFENELNDYISYFDRIVLCDVLEHLTDPMGVLVELSKYLKDDGKFLIDVPNISHGSIKYNLLLDNFEYTPMGLLDRTHVHFFTLSSLIKDLSENNFLIEKIEYVFLGSDRTSDQFVDFEDHTLELVDYIENDILSSVYQIFVVVEKSDLSLNDTLIHNMAFNEFNPDMNSKKDKYVLNLNVDPVKSIKEIFRDKNRIILDLKNDLTYKNDIILDLESNIKSKDNSIFNLKKSLKDKNNSIIRLNNNINVRNESINYLNKLVNEMEGSNSWKVTKPLRNFTFLLRRLKNRSSPKKSKTAPKNTNFINFRGEAENYCNAFYSKNPNNNQNYYVPKSNRFFDRDENDPKLIAFYLPQFHTIPENDEWWGKGFTEWINVTRAVPQINGHYQPHLPDELGFYDLSHKDIFYKQIDLAKKYGIYGFCFHYYWFSGKRLLEKPIFNYLNDKNLDFPFMLCWANEPWTRAWDGSEREVLMPQTFEEEDYVKFIEDVMPFFKDDRYIKVNNCPILIVYRPQYFSKEAMNAAIEIWRDYVKQNGFDDIYLVNAESHDFDSNNKYENFDASVQFFSYKMSKNWRRDEKAVVLNPEFNGQIYDYESFVKEKTYLQDFDYTLFRTVLPSWDNTARTMSNAIIFNNSSPELYKEWLDNVIKYTRKNYSKDKQFVFLHSWNEWAEGAHLEPDRKYGFAYLESTLDVLESQKNDSG